MQRLFLRIRPQLNPLWGQNRLTIDSDQHHRAIHGTTYGIAPEARPLAAYSATIFVFRIGVTERGEHNAGMTYHGETTLSGGKRFDVSTDALAITALPAGIGVALTRTLECRGERVLCEGVSRKCRRLGTARRMVRACNIWSAISGSRESPGSKRRLTRGFRTGEDTPAGFVSAGRPGHDSL